MNQRKPVIIWAASAMLLLAASVALGFGWGHHTTHVRPLTGIPDREYQFEKRSPVVSALSHRAKRLGGDDRIAETEVEEKIDNIEDHVVHVFDFPKPMRIGDATLTRVNLLVVDNGWCLLNLKAAVVDENTSEDLASIPADMSIHTGGDLRRRNFHISLRGLQMPLGNDSPDLAPGRPVLFQIPLEGFWVGKGRSRMHRMWFHSRAAATFFRHIDRVEVVFSVQ